MLMARPHIMIVRDSLNEGADLFDINWSLHGSYSLYFFTLWFKTSRFKPIS